MYGSDYGKAFDTVFSHEPITSELRAVRNLGRWVAEVAARIKDLRRPAQQGGQWPHRLGHFDASTQASWLPAGSRR